MATFTFRLQPLMKLREAERDQCREQLAEAYRADQILSERHEEIVSQMQEAKQLTRSQSQPGEVSVDALMNTHRYEIVLTAQLQQLALQRQRLAEEIERRRQALVEADRELRILEKLRERHEAEFRRQEEKLETRQLDEMALRRRQTTNGGSSV
jgi:flagellar FliJ protein